MSFPSSSNASVTVHLLYPPIIVQTAGPSKTELAQSTGQPVRSPPLPQRVLGRFPQRPQNVVGFRGGPLQERMLPQAVGLEQQRGREVNHGRLLQSTTREGLPGLGFQKWLDDGLS